jgi:hypothetical protein
MWILSEPKLSAVIADRLFPSQMEVNYSQYRLAKSRFFREMKKIHPQELNSFFSENYYSESGIAWFIFKDTRYFTILLYEGTAIEQRYYGKQIVFFNP